MKIEFESRMEIQRICSLLQDIFPAAICITTDDLTDARDGSVDRELPWNWDGFHPCIEVADKKVDKAVNKTVDKEVSKGPHPMECDCMMDPDGWAECDFCSFVSGQLDAIFRCMREGKLSLRDAVEVTGRSAVEIKHLYNVWVQKSCG